MNGENGWNRNEYDLAYSKPVLGAPMNMVTPQGRENFTKVMTSIAMVGGGVYALMSIPGAKAPKQVALGALGGGLLFASLINFYDAIA